MSSAFEKELRDMIREIVRDEIRDALADAGAADEYLSTRAAAQLADVAEGTIRRWIREGKLPKHRAGRLVRVLRADLESAMKSDEALVEETPEQLARRHFG